MGKPKEFTYRFPEGMNALYYPGGPKEAVRLTPEEMQANAALVLNRPVPQSDKYAKYEEFTGTRFPRLYTPEEKVRDKKQLIVMLSRAKDGDTDWNLTTKELAEIFGYKEKGIEKIQREGGIYRFPRPEVRHEPLPENQEAFFRGFAHGNYSVGTAHWGESEFGYLETQGSEKKRKTVADTLGTWGTIHDNSSGMRVYVDPLSFNFLSCPEVDEEYLDKKSRYAPFVFGLMTSRLNEAGTRLSDSHGDVIPNVHKNFSKFFGFEMGKLHIERRASSSSKTPEGTYNPLPVIHISDPEAVLGALMQTRAVSSLPFVEQAIPNFAR